MFDFIKSLGKQAIFVAVIVLAIFLFWPGFTLTLVAGIVIGLVAGNLYQPLEHFIETQIENVKNRR